MKELIEQWAKEHCKECAHYAGDYAASDCSFDSPTRHEGPFTEGQLRGEQGFDELILETYIAGAERMNQWWIERFNILMKDSPRENGGITVGFITNHIQREQARDELIKAAGEK